MIASVINAATLTPTLITDQSKPGSLHADEDLLQPRLGQMAGQEGEMFAHASSRFDA